MTLKGFVAQEWMHFHLFCSGGSPTVGVAGTVEAAVGAAAVVAGATVTGVSVGVVDADSWDVTGVPSELAGVNESPPEAGAALGAAALAGTCKSNMPNPSCEQHMHSGQCLYGPSKAREHLELVHIICTMGRPVLCTAVRMSTAHATVGT